MRGLLSLALALGLAATPLYALEEWYDYYLRARDRLIPAGKCQEAIESLKEAVRIKPGSALQEQTYGLQFIDYLPYYWQGVCYLKVGDYTNATRLFNAEEDRGAIRKSPVYRELIKQRTEADNAWRQQLARQARQEVERLLRESGELAKGRKFDDALAKLFEADALAKSLDPATQRLVAEARERIRVDAQDLQDAAARAQRLELALGDAERSLGEGKATEAMRRFDDALTLDPRNARALDGKKAAQERILALTTQKERDAAFQHARALFDAGEYERALGPLTDAAADPRNALARDYLERARRIVEGTFRQKEIQARIEELLARGERLFAAGKFPESEVSFEGVLRLDPGNSRAKERLASAESKTGEALFARWLPNQSPLLTILEPQQAAEIEGPVVAVVGVATDDRGMARIEFRIGGTLKGQELLSAALPAGEARRTLSFQRRFPLEKGQNELTITAIDDMGASRRESLVVNRRLRFYETAYFLPSALASSLGLLSMGYVTQRLRRRGALRRRFNPYIAGAPVLDDRMFFGRQKLLARMLNVLHHNSLMITGERRIGKTSFLYHLGKVLAADEGTEYRFFPVFIDLQGVPELGFFHALMADVADSLGLGEKTRDSLRFRPRLEGRYDGRDFSHDLQRVLEELKTRTPRTVKLALLIDEVDVLNEYSEGVNQRLRSIFMKTFSLNLVAVMSGVGIKRNWTSEVSPWYNFFDEVELSAFTREEAEELIKTPVAGYFRYQPEALERIITLSELKPYVIQRFCIHLVNRILEAGRTTITAQDVAAVQDVVLFEGASAPVAEPAAPVSA